MKALLRALGCAALAFGVLSVVTPAIDAHASSPPPGVHISAAYPPYYKQLSAVACPSATDCYAVGKTSAGAAAVVASADGGSTWTDQSVPSGVTSLTAIACSSGSSCVAVGAAGSTGAIVATTDSGTTWVSQSLPHPPAPYFGVYIAPLDAVACPSLDECFAGGNALAGYLTTSDAGSTWTLVSSDSTHPAGVNGLTCPSTDVCQATTGTDSVWATADGGTTWANDVPIPGAQLVAVTCATTALCFAVGSNGSGAVIATDTSGTWADDSASVEPTLTALNAVTCISAGACYAVGEGDATGYGSLQAGAVVAWGGSEWELDTLQDDMVRVKSLSGIACTANQACVAVGTPTFGGISAGLLTTNVAPIGWQFKTLPHTGPGPLGSIACLTSIDCLAFGLDSSDGAPALVSSANAGQSWSADPVPSWLDPGPASCPTARDCFVASGDSVAVTHDGGQTWSDGPSLGSNPIGISCPNSNICYALAGPVGMSVTFDGGATWQHSFINPPTMTASGISCPGTSTCYLVGSSPLSGNPAALAFSNDTGATWTTSTLGAGSSLRAISCASTTTCIAVGNGAVTTTNSGATWTPQTVPGGSDLYAVSCPTASWCAAVGGAAGGGVMDTTSNAGHTWTGQTMPTGTSPSLGLAGVACPQAGECFAVGWGTNGSDILSYSGPAVTTTSLPTAKTGVLYSASLAATGGESPYEWSVSAGSLPAGLTLNSGTGTITGAPTSAGTSSFTVTVSDSESTPATATANLSITVSQGPGHGYWLVGGDGGIFTFGNAHFYGSTGDLHLQRPVVGMTPTADVRGYWMVAGDGGMFAFGDAKFHGSIPGLGFAPAGSGAPKSLDAPIVAMVASPTGNGYLLVASDGGVFAFGDAKFHGSCPQIGGCNGSVVAVVPDHGELGYWVVTSTGHVYAFGDAASMITSHATSIAAPIAGAAATPSGRGFLMVDALGHVYADGDGAVLGPPPTGVGLANLVTGIVPTSSGHGYWLMGAAGAVYPYGDAPHDGSMAGHQLNAPIVTAAGF